MHDQYFTMLRVHLPNCLAADSLITEGWKWAKKYAMSFDLDEGFGNFLNCTRKKSVLLRLNRH